MAVTTINVWPRRGYTYPDELGNTITSAGSTEPVSEYILDACRDGFLLTHDPAADDPSSTPIEIGFTDDPIYISVSFGDTLTEELAYRDGEFRVPYTQSTIVGNTVFLRRDGGFPETAVPHFEEPAPAPGAAPWSLLYSVDFTSLAARTFSTNGAHTIDGLTWYRKAGSGAGGSSVPSIEAGLGLRPSNIFVAEGGSYGNRMFLPFASVPGYNLGAPVAIQYRSYAPTAGPIAIVGIADYAADGAQPATAQFNAGRGFSWNGGSAGSVAQSGLNLWRGGSQNSAALGVSLAPTDTGLGLQVINARTSAASGFVWASAPDPFSGTFVPTQVTTSADLINTTYAWDLTKLGVYIAHNAAISSYVTHLKIWQPVSP